MHEIDKIIAVCRSVIEAGSRGVLVTVVRTQGSTYRRAGARAVIGEDGTLAGAISGGGLGRGIAARRAMGLGDIAPPPLPPQSSRSGEPILGPRPRCRGGPPPFLCALRGP